MSPSLITPNALVGIVAMIGALEAAALVTAAVAGMLVYRRLKRLLDRVENQLAGPQVASLDAVVKDIKEIASTAREETVRLDQFVRTCLEARTPKRRRSAEAAPTLH
jgi:hypothetical protein